MGGAQCALDGDRPGDSWLLQVWRCSSPARTVAIAVDGAGAATPQQTLTPVTQSVLSPPRWYHGDDGRFHLSYELEMTNAVADHEVITPPPAETG